MTRMLAGRLHKARSYIYVWDEGSDSRRMLFPHDFGQYRRGDRVIPAWRFRVRFAH